ncbi:hypothetical protein PP304_gp059 [Gordonia phage Phendrix]|nr:hypothetical protein PP304_gp059 [Gordonia phage Phendrix]QDK02607.1 hypothetical protein SEA_PHENDRIX_59 [Gordonia phage Phendrix]
MIEGLPDLDEWAAVDRGDKIEHIAPDMMIVTPAPRPTSIDHSFIIEKTPPLSEDHGKTFYHLWQASCTTCGWWSEACDKERAKSWGHWHHTSENLRPS